MVADPIRFRCKCGTNLKTKPEAAGRVIRCPKCEQQLTVPQAELQPGSPAIRYTIKKNIVGPPSIKYDCPGCDIRLTSAITEAGSREICPDCNTEFVVPGTKERQQRDAEQKRIKAKSDARKEANRIERQRRKDERNAAMDNARAERERQKASAAELERQNQIEVRQPLVNRRSDSSEDPTGDGVAKNTVKRKSHRKRYTLITLVATMLFFRVFCGIFVVQPIGAIPDGVTIVYWRSGMNISFIASADGILHKSGDGVSLFGRGAVLAALSETLNDRAIVRLGYSRTLYLWSTGGREFSN